MAPRSNSLPLPPQGDIHAGAAAAAAGKTGSSKEQQQHPGRTKLTVNTSKMSSNKKSRSKPASPVLSPSAGFGAAEFNNQDPQFKMDDYFAMSLIGAGNHNHHHPNSGPSRGKPLSAGRNGSETQSSSHALAHSRSYSTSSNPRPEHPHSHHLGTSQAHYGGITSRPSSRASTDKLRSPHGSPPTSRPSSPSSRSRSTSRYRSSANVHSPLLYGNEGGSSTSVLSSGNSEYFHGHPRTSGRATMFPVLVQQTWTRWKANLGIGTGEWIDPHDSTKWVIPVRLKAYVPLLVWVAVSIAMAAIVGIWHSQVFSFLESLSVYLKSQGYFGDFILFLCIFITTFPPLPLYSTFIFLAGYSFGLVEAFLISYAAALSGAVVVFLLSKRCLKDRMVSLLDASPGLKKVVRAIERRPKLLFLIRLSPYPYNVMNVLLASSQTLSFSCYFWCTALSLPKLIIHCSVGTTIRSFAESTSSNPATEGAPEEEMEAERQGQRLKAIAGAVGIALCIGLFIYLCIVARRAVDDLDDSERLPSLDSPEGSLHLSRSPETSYRALPSDSSEMREVNVHTSEPRTSMVHQRHTFERQDSTLGMMSAGRQQGGWGGAWSADREKGLGKFEEEWIDDGGQIVMSDVVAGLERAAAARRGSQA